MALKHKWWCHSHCKELGWKYHSILRQSIVVATSQKRIWENWSWSPIEKFSFLVHFPTFKRCHAPVKNCNCTYLKSDLIKRTWPLRYLSKRQVHFFNWHPFPVSDIHAKWPGENLSHAIKNTTPLPLDSFGAKVDRLDFLFSIEVPRGHFFDVMVSVWFDSPVPFYSQ